MLGRIAWLAFVLALGVGATLVFRIPQLQLVHDLGTQAFAPLQTILGGPASDVSGVFGTLQNVSELRVQNTQLREDLDRLVGETTRLRELERENQELREQLGLKGQKPSLEWLSTQIIYSDPSNLVQSVTIGAGRREGIRDGMTVMTPRGLVGRVVAANATTSRVLLITDAGSSVSALIQGSRAKGVINGQRRELLSMRYIPQSETVRTGDKVVTSGVGGVFPDGILIGRITDVTRKDVDMFQQAQIEPEVDFTRLDRVLVVINHLPLTLE